MKENYFEQKIEPRLGRFKKIPDYFFNPVAEIEWKENDDIEARKDGIIIKFSYRSMDFKDLSSDEKALFPETAPKNPNTVKIIKSLVVSNELRNKIDISPFFQSGFRVFFLTEKTGQTGNFSIPERKLIIMTDNPLKPSFIFSLLHELGHCINHELRKTNNYKKTLAMNDAARILQQHKNVVEVFGVKIPMRFSKEKLKEAFPLILENERDAWAFTIRKIKPILGSGVFSRENILNYVHNFYLQNYSNYFRVESGGFKEKIVDKILDYLENIIKRNET